MVDQEIEAMVEGDIQRYREVRKAVGKNRALRLFFYHLTTYAVANIFLGAWNIWTYQNLGNTTLWFFSPLIFWGIGVIVHYVQAVALFDEWWQYDEKITAMRLVDQASSSELPPEHTQDAPTPIENQPAQTENFAARSSVSSASNRS